MTLPLDDMSGDEIGLLADVFRDLALAEATVDPRTIVAERVLTIMRSDILASFIWNEATRTCTRPIVVNQDAGMKPGHMFHDINIPVHDGDRRIFDLRLWRSRSRPKFERRDSDLLNTIARHMLPAMRRVLSSDHDSLALTARETEIARLVARGCIDREIAGVLGISFSTVRTHINRCFEKLGCSNRAELSSRFAVTVPLRMPA